MSYVVRFDEKGVFGPVTTLIYQAGYFNKSTLLDLTKLIKENFKNLTSTKIKGRKFFCEHIHSVNNLGLKVEPMLLFTTTFFNCMQSKEPSPCRKELTEILIPNMLKFAQEKVPHDPKIDQEPRVIDWFTRFAECYMKPEQITSSCQTLQSSNSEAIKQERSSIGQELYAAASSGKLTEAGLDRMLALFNSAYTRTIDFGDIERRQVVKFTGQYLKLVSTEEDREQADLLAEDIVDKIGTLFKQKLWPKESQPCSSQQ